MLFRSRVSAPAHASLRRVGDGRLQRGRRIVDHLEATSTFKSRKVDLREEGYGHDVTDPLYVLGGRREGFVPFHDAYPGEVAAGVSPKP